MSSTRKPRPTRLEEAYQHFLLDRQSMPVAPSTLQLYGWTVGRFVAWTAAEHPEVGSFDDLGVEVVRTFRAQVAASVTKTGGRPARNTCRSSTGRSGPSSGGRPPRATRSSRASWPCPACGYR